MENYTIPHRWTRKYLALILVKPRPGQDGEAVILAQKSNARRPQNLRLAISWESIEDLDCQDYVLADIPRKDVKKQELKDPIPLFAGSVFTKSRNNASARQGGLIFKYGKVDNGGSEDEDPGLDVSGLVEKEALGSANGKLSSGTAVWMGSSDVEYQASVDYMVTDRWLQGAVAGTSRLR